MQSKAQIDEILRQKSDAKEIPGVRRDRRQR